MSKPKHDSLSAELMYLIGRATAPMSSAELYEKCELTDDITNVASTLSELKSQGRIVRVEGEGRARYALADGITAPAPAGKAGRSKAVRKDAAAHASTPRGDTLPPIVIPTLESPLPASATAGQPDGLDKIAAAHRAPAEGDHAKADARLADALIARLKRDLAPVFGKPVVSDLDVTTAPGVISINVERVEIHISVGVAA